MSAIVVTSRLILLLFAVAILHCFGMLHPMMAQATGGGPLPGRSVPPSLPGAGDTTIVFPSPRPLLSEQQSARMLRQGLGVDVIFSSNGFGAGVFYQRIFSETLSGFVNLGVSGARNTDEIEYYDPYAQRTFIPFKINRLYIFPLTVGAQYRLFADNIAETLRPYVSAGLGTTFVVAAPYEYEFFQSLGHANTYTRFGGFVGVGANFGAISKSMMGVNARYYFIPFGGDGIESIKDSPIHDFGGLFLSLSVSFLN
ncbi:MAG: hypothetical protein U0264_04150 [Candidatus Kapaibacterium sp.]